MKFLENMRRPSNKMEQIFAKNYKKLRKGKIMKSPDKYVRTKWESSFVRMKRVK